MTLDEFLDRLEGVKPAGTGYVAICPAHEDQEPSLGVSESEEGILVRCHAGCATVDVMEAMGLKLRDLFFKTTNYAEPEAVYSYVDEAGQELFQAVRFPGKKFRQRHHDSSHEKADAEGWVWNLEGVRRVLYRLPEVIAAVAAGQTIYLCEGEKDVEALRAHGKVATCNPMGAGKWREEFIAFLAGANVVIVADRDAPGRAHAERIKQSLIGRARGVWVVQAARGKDAYDHLVTHKFGVQDFRPLKEAIRRGVITSGDMADAALERLDSGPEELPSYAPVPEIYAQDIGTLAFRKGRLYVLGGYTGDGKSALALQVTVGLCQRAVHTAYFTFEMTEEDITNRLIVQLTTLPLSFLEEPWSMNEDQKNVVRQAIETIRSWPLEVIYRTNMSVEEIAQQVESGEYEFVVVDHLHEMPYDDRRSFEKVVTSMKNIALDLNIPVLLLAQLRRFQRGKDTQVYPRPILQDFKESGSIEQSAAMALAIWRTREPDGIRYSPSNVSELIVLKNRHGKSGRSYFLQFDGPRMVFASNPYGGGQNGSIAVSMESSDPAARVAGGAHEAEGGWVEG